MNLEIARIDDLKQVHQLQKDNLRTPENDGDNGFVELDLTPDQLRLIIESEAAIVAREGDEVAGYLLVPSFEVARQIETIRNFIDFVTEHQLIEEGTRIFSVCVSSAYRGRGLASQLYAFYRSHFSEPAISEVVETNVPSWRLHVGKEQMPIIKTYKNGRGEHVAIIMLSRNQ